MNAPQEHVDPSAPSGERRAAEPGDRGGAAVDSGPEANAPEHGASAGVPGRHSGGSLNRPLRAAVAVGEVVLAALVVWAAVWVWQQGVVTSTVTRETGNGGSTRVEVSRYYGDWIAGAIALGTAAGILLLDAARQLALALRTRPRKAKPRQRDTDPQPEG